VLTYSTGACYVFEYAVNVNADQIPVFMISQPVSSDCNNRSLNARIFIELYI